MKIDSIDHLVLTVKDIEATCAFYGKALGMEVVTFAEGRKALAFGSQKINLHQQGPRIRAQGGSSDAGIRRHLPDHIGCLAEVIAHLNACRVEIIDGPVKRTGAVGTLMSVYFRDPDLNLIEVSNNYIRG